MQETFSTTFAATTMEAGWFMVRVLTVVQPFASVTVTVYVPEGMPERSLVERPLLQLNPYGETPPLTSVVAFPEDWPKQAASCEMVLSERAGGSVMVTVAVSEQPPGLVTVTVYV